MAVVVLQEISQSELAYTLDAPGQFSSLQQCSGSFLNVSVCQIPLITTLYSWWGNDILRSHNRETGTHNYTGLLCLFSSPTGGIDSLEEVQGGKLQMASSTVLFQHQDPLYRNLRPCDQIQFIL
jgi:hypothetical protein